MSAIQDIATFLARERSAVLEPPPPSTPHAAGSVGWEDRHDR